MPIRQEVFFDAPPARVYRALTDAKEFSAVTGGAPAEIDARDGGVFSCFGGAITGRNIELRADRRVVQAWRAGNWPEGVYSIVRFELHPDKSGTRLAFDQSGHPSEQETHLEGGWHKMYWTPLKGHLASA